MKKKHKKKHNDWSHSGAKNISPIENEEKKVEKKDNGSDLIEIISSMEAAISTVGLTAEDINALKARLDIANAKLVAAKHASDSAARAKAYAEFKDEVETKTAAYEALANADLSTQELIDATNASKSEINTEGLMDEDIIMFKIRIDEADEKIASAQKAMDLVETYARTKAEMEKKIVEIELLANASLLKNAREIDAKEDFEEYALRKEKDKNIIHPISKINRNKIYVAVFLFLVIGSYAVAFQQKYAIKNEIAFKDKTEKYIKDYLVQPGTDLKITDFAKEGGLYKFTVEVGGQSVVSYITGDGKRLLLNPVDLDKKSDGSSENTPPAQASAEASQKKDVPDIELFVMSLCPYGVQAEKGILPVVEKLGSKINFDVKFVDYTLHGKKEFDENLNQYCIQKEEPEKFNDSKIASCTADSDKQFKLTENFSASAQSSPFNIHKDLNEKYGVQGSPSLVVNGQLLDAGRDSASLLKTICSGFSNQPDECKAELSSVSPSPGFGK